jgi:teichuronic acid biosynthesis glycosyltransferase TuaG
MMEKEPAFVSVIIPAFKAAALLPFTVQSVMEQDYPHFEVIIVDDGSPDNTYEVARQLELKWPGKVKALRQENGRQGKARNTGIAHARGNFIAFLDADDEWTSDKIRVQLDVLLRNQLDLVYSDGFLIPTDAHRPLLELLHEGHEKVPMGAYIGNLEGASGIRLLHRKNRIPTSSVLCKKDAIERAGGFIETRALQNCEDYLLWVKMAEQGCRMRGIPEKHLLYRMHPNSSTNGILNAFSPLVRSLFVMHAPLTDDLRIQLAGHIRTLTEELVQQGKLAEARDIFEKYNATVSQTVWRVLLQTSFRLSPQKWYLSVLWRHTALWLSRDVADSERLQKN